jgi:ABC-2 type transport system ATP-binding protein
VLLEVNNLTKTYRSGVKANDDISIWVESGEVFGLLGPNGAGKTTLVSQILGSVVPTSGSIRINGVDVVQQPGYARRVCSYQPQTSVPIEGVTPSEAIEIVGRIRGGERKQVRARASQLMEELDITEWASKGIPLSGGVARLVAFCMATVVPGRIVVLDEPTNDVDPLRRKLLWSHVQRLADEGSAVLLVTHNVLEAERCVDRLAIVGAGRVLVSGTAAAVKSDHSGWLRLEILLEPDNADLIYPEFLHRPTVSGRRVMGEIEIGALPAATQWASRLREQHLAEEFSIGPITLEDVYVRQVKGQDPTFEFEEAGAA